MLHLKERTLALALILAVIGLVSPAQAKEESKVKTTFEALTDAGGAGNAKFKGTGDGAALIVRLSGLGDGEFTFESNGVERFSFDSEDGKAKLRLVTPERDGVRHLFFDPREGSLVILDSDGTALLSASLEGEEGTANLKEVTFLEPTELADDGVAEARFDERPNGKERLRIHLRGAPTGDYQILFDGVEQEQVTTNPGGNAKATFDLADSGSSANRNDGNGDDNGKGKGKDKDKNKDKGKGKDHNKKSDLDFDGLNALIEIVRGSDLYWSGHLRAQIPGLNQCDEDGLATMLEPTGALVAGTADASFDIAADCVRRFEVSVQGLVAGTVDVAVDGVIVGTIDVVDDGVGTSGTIVFSTEPVGDELALTFDPVDVPIDVSDDVEVLFTGSLMSSAP